MITAYSSFSGFVGTERGTPLLDAVTCVIKEELNGCFDLYLQNPLNGQGADLLTPNAIITAPTNGGGTEQPFRIYQIEQNIEGLITVYAHHIVYDLDGVIAYNAEINGISQAIFSLNIYAGPNFEIVNDGIIDETEQFNIFKPISVFSALGGSNSLLSHFGGELEYAWDDTLKKCIITLHTHRGEEKNTVIAYGVNIVSLLRKQTVGDMYSLVFAYWSDGEHVAETQISDGVYTGVTEITRVLMLDESKTFESRPTVAQLNAIAQDYVSRHDFTMQNELSVEYVPLDDTTNYEPLDVAVVDFAIVDESVVGDLDNIMHGERLLIGDTATVDASLIGVTAKARCMATEFDAILEKYNKVTIGTLQETIADVIVRLEREVF